MSTDPRADAEAFGKQYDQEQAAEESAKSKVHDPLEFFLQDYGANSRKFVDRALNLTDGDFNTTVPGGGGLVHPHYHRVRDAVVAFLTHYQSGEVNDAICKMCIPLLAYARLCGQATIIAKYGQAFTDRGVKPTVNVRLVDLHILGTAVQKRLLDVLNLIDSKAANELIHLLAGVISPETLDDYLMKHVKPVQAALMTDAAEILKDAHVGTTGAIKAGVRSTHDLLPPPQLRDMSGRTRSEAYTAAREFYVRRKEERRRAALGPTPEEGGGNFEEEYGHGPREETTEAHIHDYASKQAKNWKPSWQ